jgi:hypothetical protein
MLQGADSRLGMPGRPFNYMKFTAFNSVMPPPPPGGSFWNRNAFVVTYSTSLSSGFGVGGMVQSGFRISEPFENPNALACRSVLFLINAALYLVFVFLQTFFIFKYHKVSR